MSEGEPERRDWRRAARTQVPFVALIIWLTMAVGLIVWAATK